MNKYYLISMILTLLGLSIFACYIRKDVTIVFKLFNKIKIPAQQMLYSILVFLCAYLYIFGSVRFNNMFGEFSSVVNSVYLFLCIWIPTRLIKMVFPQDELTKSDKHWAIILSYVSVAISGMIVFMEYSSKMYLTVSSVAISVLIGLYISADILLEKQSLIKYVNSIKFMAKNVKLIMSTSVVFAIILFLGFSPYSDIVNEIINGIGMGAVIFLFGFISYILCSLKIRG